MKKIELLAPAGNLEKLKYAIMYGADAVYIGGESFSLRDAADNFSIQQMIEGVEYAHQNGAKVYVALNIFPHNQDIDEIQKYIMQLKNTGIDALIVADIGTLAMCKEFAPEIDVHISTQANVTNYKSVNVMEMLGAKRVVLARELSIDEIADIKNRTNIEIETFVHGAMCVSYSGRCLLSNYLAARDSNKGECAQPCRWKYFLTEENRKDQPMEIVEQENGTFIFNSKDLSMIGHIKELVESGVDSIKIEGRVKSFYYVATVVKAYREAIDRYYNGQDIDSMLDLEVRKVSHRDYYTGFYFNKPDNTAQVYTSSSYIRGYDFVGVIEGNEDGHSLVRVKNKMIIGDTLEIISPNVSGFDTYVLKEMRDETGENIIEAPHPERIIKIKFDKTYIPNSIVRKVK